jgi:hypothetical protein
VWGGMWQWSGNEKTWIVTTNSMDLAQVFDLNDNQL